MPGQKMALTKVSKEWERFDWRAVALKSGPSITSLWRTAATRVMDVVLNELGFLTRWPRVRKSVSVLIWSVLTTGPVSVHRSANGCKTWFHRPGAAPLPEWLVTDVAGFA